MSLKNNTIKTYETSLEKMKNMKIDLDNVDVDVLIGIFDSHNIPLSTQNSYLSAFQWYNKNNNKSNKIIDDVSAKIRLIRERKMKEYKKNKFSQKEETKYIPWEKVKEIYNDLKCKAYTGDDLRTNQDFLLLSFYMHHPPRRATDYQNMYFDVIDISKDKQKILWMNKESIAKYEKEDVVDEKGKPFEEKILEKTNKNYYMKNGNMSFFIFDDYKTYDVYGRQIVEVNRDLDDIIKRHITIYGIALESKLLDLSYENYLKRLNNIFYSYTNKIISIDMLRHIYVNKMIEDTKLCDTDRQKIARLMGHSNDTQKIYRKIAPSEYTEFEITPENYTNKKIYKKYATDEERNEARKHSKKEWYEANKKKVKHITI